MKKIVSKNIFWGILCPLLFMFLLNTVSCSDSDQDGEQPFLNIPSTEIEINRLGLSISGDSASIEVLSNVYWTLRIDADNNWLTTNITGGHGTQYVILQAKQYDGAESQKATLTFETLDGITAQVNVLQQGTETPALYFNTKADQVQAESTPIDTYTGWGLTGAGSKTSRISGEGIFVSNENPSINYEGASGLNNLLFEDSNATLLIGPISTLNVNEFELSFGASSAASSFNKDDLIVSVSADNVLWSTLDYARSDNPEWEKASSNFSFRGLYSTIYFKIEAKEAGIFRIDDIALADTGTDASPEDIVFGININYVDIPAGSFNMGSPDSEPKNKSIIDEILHPVTITKPFQMSEFVITNTEFATFLNFVGVGKDGMYETEEHGTRKLIDGQTTNSRHLQWKTDINRWACTVPESDELPVVRVTWYGAYEFAKWAGAELPTEAQWEYACRAGTTSPFAIGPDDGYSIDYTWANFSPRYPYSVAKGGTYSDSSAPAALYQTSAIYTYPANAWGLYSMHGNVREWCSDWYADYDLSIVNDPTGPATGTARVLRGGGTDNGAEHLRSARRVSADPEAGIGNAVGFRVVKNN